jgi:hypothetical protein
MAINAQRLRSQCLYEGQGPLGSLLVDVDEIGRVVAACQADRRKLRWWSLYCLIGSVVVFIASFVVDSQIVLLLAIIAFLACFGLFIYSFVYARQLVKHCNRYELLKQLLATIQQDAHSKAPFAVRLSLSSVPLWISGGAWEARKNGKQNFYKESWLSIDGPLLDGTTLTEDITELSRKRTYKNPRGKTKTKTRSRYLVTLRFAYSKELYGDARQAQLALHQDVRVGPSAKVRAVRVTEKAIMVKGLVQSEKDVAQTASLLSLGSYRILNLARRGVGR